MRQNVVEGVIEQQMHNVFVELIQGHRGGRLAAPTLGSALGITYKQQLSCFRAEQ